MTHRFAGKDKTMIKYILDFDPQRDDDASPMSTYRCILRVKTYLNVDLSSLAQVRIQVKFNFELS